MFKFLKIQYKLGRIGEDELQQAVTKGWITEEQKNLIMQEQIINYMLKLKSKTSQADKWGLTV